jgi:23S rRNA-/tRNA-specific pseudouridylate synthase
MHPGVSGVLLVARSSLARREMPRQFAREEIEKSYLAIIHAAPQEPSGTIDLEIGPDKNGPARMRVGGSHARPAVTQWTLRDRYAGFAVLECRTRRERIDQVRLHLQAMGMPLAVDTEYGGAAGLMLSSFKPDYRPSRRHEERPLIGRISLHAQKIELKHPRTGEAMRFEVPPPKDFRAAMNQLDKHGRIGVPPRPAGE